MSWKELSRFANHWSRGSLLREHAGDLSTEDYWSAVAQAWSDSDRQDLTPADWRTVWLADAQLGREQAMTIEEREQLGALPERVSVYRGVNQRNHITGLSWTLDRDLAHWFAWRHVPPNEVSTPGLLIGVRSGIVLRHRIIALIQERNEHEILVQPKYVHARSWEAADLNLAGNARKAK